MGNILLSTKKVIEIAVHHIKCMRQAFSLMTFWENDVIKLLRSMNENIRSFNNIYICEIFILELKYTAHTYRKPSSFISQWNVMKVHNRRTYFTSIPYIRKFEIKTVIFYQTVKQCNLDIMKNILRLKYR